ncbi:MAG TPA: hypothetical protein PLE50_08245 [Rhabdaerophilum sp.]|nr:hypothetical protein [Rhabdaerophilum sp.]
MNSPAPEHFPPKWVPVERKKMRQHKKMERPFRFFQIERHPGGQAPTPYGAARLRPQPAHRKQTPAIKEEFPLF